MAPAESLMCRAHEARLQSQEEVVARLAASDAAAEVRFQMIQDSIADLSRTLTEAIERVEKRVEASDARVEERIDAIEKAQSEQGDLLKSLSGAEKARKDAKKLYLKLAAGVGLPLVGAIATKWGEAIWTWLTR